MIVTIDGPAGAGKSTVARRLAQRLKIRFLDTGAMYRAVAYKALRERADLSDGPALAVLIRALHLEMPDDRVLLDGADITGLIRTPEITDSASRLSALPEVRAELVRLQREIGRRESLVTEGRDQGSVVFPDAEHKFYLFADLDERARRRQKDLGEPLQAVREEIRRRDERDMTRAASPLRPPDGAVSIDTTRLTIDQVVRAILAHIEP